MSIWEYLRQLFFNSKQKKIAIAIAGGLVLVALIVVLVVSLQKEEKKPSSGDKGRIEIEISEDNVPDGVPELDEEDPQVTISEDTQREEGAEVDLEDIVTIEKPQAAAYGIDVSKYQGKIDWEKVAKAGIDFVMVRVGYRTLVSGKILEDDYAKYNMKQASIHGIKVGAYFFSAATSVQEALEEANWTADYVANYNITYPIAYDCEGFEDSDNRHYGINPELRTDIALAFMNRIAERGYTSLFYGSKNHMEDYIWEMDRISSIYNVWVAQYPAKPYPETTHANYAGKYVMWQYTNRGTVAGIQKPVDMNISYIGYEGSIGPSVPPEDSNTPQDQPPAFQMTFTDVNEQVTAKEETNLRNIPSQGTDSQVMYTLRNGEVATRTGVSNSGWSRVVYNGTTYYAVSSLLTTDLNYKPPQDDGIKTQFTEVNEQVTPKEEINLRKKPSVDDSIAPIVVTIKKGEVITRTGINTDVGWSRVVWQGQTLYCVSQYLQPVAP